MEKQPTPSDTWLGIVYLMVWLGMILGLAYMATGCASARQTMRALPATATNVEADDIVELCEHAPAHRSRAQHRPVMTSNGTAVWCY